MSFGLGDILCAQSLQSSIDILYARFPYFRTHLKIIDTETCVFSVKLKDTKQQQSFGPVYGIVQ